MVTHFPGCLLSCAAPLPFVPCSLLLLSAGPAFCATVFIMTYFTCLKKGMGRVFGWPSILGMTPALGTCL